MLWQSSKADPILSETADCIQSTDYLHTKPDLLPNLDSSGPHQPLRLGNFAQNQTFIRTSASVTIAPLLL
jgi:hypothetical protein